jgi:hypothetical protein
MMYNAPRTKFNGKFPPLSCSCLDTKGQRMQRHRLAHLTTECVPRTAVALSPAHFNARWFARAQACPTAAEYRSVPFSASVKFSPADMHHTAPETPPHQWARWGRFNQGMTVSIGQPSVSCCQVSWFSLPRCCCCGDCCSRCYCSRCCCCCCRCCHRSAVSVLPSSSAVAVLAVALLLSLGP